MVLRKCDCYEERECEMYEPDGWLYYIKFDRLGYLCDEKTFSMISFASAKNTKMVLPSDES
jgi:hypothetical protein